MNACSKFMIKLVRIDEFVGKPSNASGSKMSATHSTQAKLPSLTCPSLVETYGVDYLLGSLQGGSARK